MRTKTTRDEVNAIGDGATSVVPASSMPAMLDLLPFPVGQPQSAALLRAALTQQRLARAYLFTGTRGVGKTVAAQWLAAQILWQSRRAESNLSQSAFLSQIQGQSYPDLVWVEPTYLINSTPVPQSALTPQDAGALTAQIRMEQAQALNQTLQRAAVGNRWVVVIEQVEKLTNEAGNALLKLLEDRLHCSFILTTSTPEQVMSTIRSRTQAVPFIPLGEADYQAVIAQVCPDLIQYPTLMAYGAGSPGQAIDAYQALCQLPLEVREQFSSFQYRTPAAGVVPALQLAKAASGLPMQVQLTLLGYLQFVLAQDNHPQTRAAVMWIEQAITLLNSRVQAQGVWEWFLCQCALQRTGWIIQMPTDCAEEHMEAVEPSPMPAVPVAVIPSPQPTPAAEQKAEFQQASLF